MLGTRDTAGPRLDKATAPMEYQMGAGKEAGNHSLESYVHL